MTNIRRYLIAAASLSLASASQIALDEESKIRHNVNSRPLELNVDAKSTYNDKFMALMESPCRPEPNGYFGATSGSPVVVTYQFEIETQPMSSVAKILDILENKVVDGVLSQAFPNMCGFRRRELESHFVSGFRFSKLQEVGKCKPEENPMDFCGVFAGQVSVYSRDKDEATESVATIIDEVMNPSDPSMFHSQLVAMTLKHQDIQRDGEVIPKKSKFDTSILAWIAFILLVCLGAVYYWRFFIRRQKQIDTGSFSHQRLRRRRVWNRPYSTVQRNHVPYVDAEETTIGPTDETESVSPPYAEIRPYGELPKSEYFDFENETESIATSYKGSRTSTADRITQYLDLESSSPDEFQPDDYSIV